MADGSVSNLDRWYSAVELAGLPGLPGTERRVRSRADADGWKSQPKARGKGLEYALASLPPATQAALLMRANPVATPAAMPTAAWSQERIDSAWQRYERAGGNLQTMAQERAKAIHAINALVKHGHGLMAARAQVAAQMQRDGIRGASVASLIRWTELVASAPAAAWSAILLPAYTGRTATAACDPQCWDWYKGHYLTRAQPSHADTYDRLRLMAKEQGWTIPSSRTLMRRIESEVCRTTLVLLREGPEAAARLLPPQKRDSSVFAPGEAINGDGLKFDRLWVKFADGEILNTATAWFYQDLATRRIVAQRLGKTENTDLFRLATYDLTGVCAPKYLWIDNTRVAANKLMTAGAAGRHRFKSDPEDGLGLLLMMGIEPHFTNPDKEVGNPGAKPIERAFGVGGLHHAVATHPKFIDRGFSKATCITEDELREVIAEEVTRHNARPGRRTQACGGVMSFDQAWEKGLEGRPIRVLSESQRRLLLMCREVVRADARSGMVTIDAGRGPHGRHRYWCEHLAQHSGRKVAVHFDPDNLSADVHIYSLDGRYLFAAQHQATVAFNDTTAAREHAKFKQRRIKAQKQVAAAETRMDAVERASLYQAATGKPEPKPVKKRNQKVVAGNFQRVPDPTRDAVRPLQRTGTDDGPSTLDLEMYRRAQAQKENQF